MTWETITTAGQPYRLIQGKACVIYLENRPHYCDRGNFIAKIFTREDAPAADIMELSLDEADGWPRYYFDENRAKAECEAWLIKRKQAVEQPKTETKP